MAIQATLFGAMLALVFRSTAGYPDSESAAAFIATLDPGVDATKKTIATVKTAIGESAFDAKLTLEASALNREAKILQTKHQESLKGLQEACREQLMAQQKSTLAESQALSKANMALQRLRTENSQIRNDAASAQQQLVEFQTNFQEFTDGVSTLQDFVTKAMEKTNPHGMPELTVVLKELSDSDANHRSATHSPKSRAVLPRTNASHKEAETEDSPPSKKSAADHRKILFLQGSANQFPGMFFEDSQRLSAAPLAKPLEDETTPLAGMLLEKSAPALWESPVERQLEEMKGKLVDIASASSRMQQNVVDQCSQAIASGAKAASEMKKQAGEAEQLQQREEDLKKRLASAKKHLVLAHNQVQRKLIDLERQVFNLSQEIVTPVTRQWATAIPEVRGESNADGDLSLLQVSSGAKATARAPRNARRHRRVSQEPSSETLLREPAGNYDNQETRESTSGASVSHAAAGTGSSMQAVAARVEELQARLSQMDVENKQAMERARYVFERQLAERQQQNRNLAESNQKIAEDIQALAKRRSALRAEANRLRKDIPAWKSDLLSLSTNFTTALEVTHKALASIDSHSQSHEIKILDDLDREDQERMAKETKRIKLQEIMAASEAKQRAAAERMEEEKQARWHVDDQMPDTDGDATGADEQEDDDASRSGELAPVFLQTSMLNKIRRAASSPNPSVLLQALDTGLADLTTEHENAKDALKRKFNQLLTVENSRHEQLLEEQKVLQAKLVSARNLDNQLQAAIRSLLDLDKQLRGQAQSLRAYTQQLGVRALPVANHNLVTLEAAASESQAEPEREVPGTTSEQTQMNMMQRSHSVHKPTAKKVSTTIGYPEHVEKMAAVRDATGKHWLSWLTR